MKESAMRKIVINALSGLDAISVENPARPGTPDVNYIEGWVELKVLEQWPVRAATKVRVPCFTPQQRLWLRRRWQRGGEVYFLILIAKDWLLFNGDVAGKHVGKDFNKNEMFKNARFSIEGHFDKRNIHRILKNGRTSTQNH